MLAAVLGIGVPVGLAGGTYLLAPRFLQYGVVLSMLVFPIVFAFLMVAYCHELNEAFEGRSPSFGAGLRVAAGRAKLVAVAGLVVGIGSFLVRSVGDSLPVGSIAGLGSAWALRIGSVFAFPAVATTEGNLDDAFEDVVAAVEAEWGKSLIATASTQLLGMVMAWAGIVAAVVLAAGAFTARFAVDAGPLGPFTLPVIVGVSGILAAILVQFTVDGILKTALYRYATEGELPTALSADADELVDPVGASDARMSQPAD
ncbi:hypothetical protein SAMN06269185_0981 [Natronoarchaeum philippinense]|uniref:Uncharacterized protein n=2 Tax=Natronoarchaeum philippinense TaxID=558529 RepID=A0A285N8X7_NATPI|nr:hypothetical protein SAMN06269185_0981 [Natronoarchaeum philippinense]